MRPGLISFSLLFVIAKSEKERQLLLSESLEERWINGSNNEKNPYPNVQNQYNN